MWLSKICKQYQHAWFPKLCNTMEAGCLKKGLHKHLGLPFFREMWLIELSLYKDDLTLVGHQRLFTQLSAGRSSMTIHTAECWAAYSFDDKTIVYWLHHYSLQRLVISLWMECLYRSGIIIECVEILRHPFGIVGTRSYKNCGLVPIQILGTNL